MSKNFENKGPILKNKTKAYENGNKAISSVFGFVGCATPNNNNTINITPAPTVSTMTVGNVLADYPTQTKQFVQGIIDEATESYNKNDITYLAFDVGDKDQTEVDDVTLYVGVKGNGNERFFMEKNCLFSPVSAENLAKGAAILSDLVIETPAPVKYDGAVK